MQKVAARTRFGRRGVDVDNATRVHPFAEAGGTRRLLGQIGPERWDEVGVVTDQPLGQAFRSGVSRVLDLEDVAGAALGEALGAADAQHLLRFTLTAPEGDLIGGYSIIVGATG